MLKDIFLQKGWAGKTISRPETVERLNPIIRSHYELNHWYEAAIAGLGNATISANLAAFQKVARADIGKLAEVVFSTGGVAYNGTDLEPADYKLEEADAVRKLAELETEFAERVEAEREIDHQMRTRAILGVVLTNSKSRSDYLGGLQRKSGRARQ